MHTLTNSDIKSLYDVAKQTDHLALVLLISEAGIPPLFLVQIKCRHVDINGMRISIPEKWTGRIPKEIVYPICRAMHGKKQEDYLFSSSKDPHKPLLQSSISKIVKKIGKQAGMANLSPRVLRTAFLVRQLRRGVNPEMLAGQVGFKSQAAIKPYIRIARSKQIDLFERPNPRLSDIA